VYSIFRKYDIRTGGAKMNFMKKTFMDSLKLIEALNIIQAEE
jgi:hypothetical protein